MISSEYSAKQAGAELGLNNFQVLSFSGVLLAVERLRLAIFYRLLHRQRGTGDSLCAGKVLGGVGDPDRSAGLPGPENPKGIEPCSVEASEELMYFKSKRLILRLGSFLS